MKEFKDEYEELSLRSLRQIVAQYEDIIEQQEEELEEHQRIIVELMRANTKQEVIISKIKATIG